MQVYITGMGLACAAGHTPTAFAQAHTAGASLARTRQAGLQQVAVAALPPHTEAALGMLAQEKRAYQRLDRAALLGMLAARQATLGLPKGSLPSAAVMMGSSRGPTHAWEQHYAEWAHHPLGRTSVWASPTTTPGNLASWVAQDLGTGGGALSLSITCSSGLMALGNAYAWLQAGLCPAVLAGATEAPLTAFTLAQLGSLRVFADADLSAGGFPCRPFSDPPQSYGGMLLAEGAAAFALVAATEPPPGALGRILGFGTATEAIPHAAGITAQGHNLAYAMRRALAHAGLQSPPGLVLAHAPGTPQGDAAELHALHQVFGPHLPPVFSHKGIVGHTLGAAGALGVALGLQCLGGHLRSLHWPYPAVLPPAQGPFATVLVNAVGFGGVAASLLLGQA